MENFNKPYVFYSLIENVAKKAVDDVSTVTAILRLKRLKLELENYQNEVRHVLDYTLEKLISLSKYLVTFDKDGKTNTLLIDKTICIDALVNVMSSYFPQNSVGVLSGVGNLMMKIAEPRELIEEVFNQEIADYLINNGTLVKDEFDYYIVKENESEN